MISCLGHVWDMLERFGAGVWEIVGTCLEDDRDDFRICLDSS